MHELGVVRSITDIVVDNAEANGALCVKSIVLEIGESRNLERYWVQEYFDRCARGTVAEGARIEIDYAPIVFECRACGNRFGYRHSHDGEPLHCERCASRSLELRSGTELLIKSIEVG